jgi:aspartate kinase
MKVFKFGGASVKDANGVRNLAKIMQDFKEDSIVLVISAMGKMTNAFEKIVTSYFSKREEIGTHIDSIKAFHFEIITALFEDKNEIVHSEINAVFKNMEAFIQQNTATDYNYVYDQIVSQAEFLSTIICSNFLKKAGVSNIFIDVRNCIVTDSDFRRAKVDWMVTCENIQNNIPKNGIIVTQGFVARDYGKNTTTLGREGSDYTAAVLAYCLNAEEVCIFKDVSGVLNADPRYFKETVLLEQISYREAIEMAFYGASVIHPKTLQPLQRKEIPLFVKSFIEPKKPGTLVYKGADLKPKTSCFIVKKNQILVSLSAKDFSFILEEDISEIFDMLHQYKIKVNLIQNSAISFSVCIEDNFSNFTTLIERLKLNYLCLFNENVTLYTIRHFTPLAMIEIEKNKEVLVKQMSRETVQIVVKS